MSASSGAGSPYRLDELGWLQFERLCALVLEAETAVGGLSWRGRSDRVRVATVGQSLVLSDPKVVLHGPVTVAVLWVREPGSGHAWLPQLVERAAPLLGDADGVAAGGLLVLTNLTTERADLMLRGEVFIDRRRLAVIGGDLIGASVDRHAAVRAALPSVLGLRDLEPLVDRDVRARSSLDVAAARGLAQVFWPTRAYERARTVLGKHGFVVLTGPPEMGKTAIGQMIALAQLTDGWEAHECTAPDQVWRVFDPSRRQVFVADDAFGSTEYRPDSAERWALGLARLLAVLDDDHWLIWTSRPAPLRAGLGRVQRERGSERFPAPAEVLVDASDLDLEEKTLILFRHAKTHGLSEEARSVLRWAGLAIVEHPHFTPERIRRFVTDRLEQLPQLATNIDSLAEMVESELAAPTVSMRNSFNALAPEHRDLLVSLLDAPEGLIDERELAVTVRRHHPGGLSRPPGELIDRLTDHFLRVTPLGIGWVHPSWRDLVIEQLQRDAAARQRFLTACGVHGVMLALSLEGGVSGERTLPLLVTDNDWDRLGDRLAELLHQLETRDLARVLLALDAALSENSDPGQGAETQSLAVYALESSRRAWHQTDQGLPAFLLDAWYRLRNHVPRHVDPPQLTATWVELHPGSALLEHPDRDELLRADEWLAIAQILNEHDLSALESLGFFTRDKHLLARLVAILSQPASVSEDTRPLVESVLNRIEELIPELAAGVYDAIAVAELVEDQEHQRWWVPHDIPAPPSTEPAATRSDFTHRDVARVLNDL